MTPISALFTALGATGTVFLIGWYREFRRTDLARSESGTPTLLHLAIGAATNFFDTLGIGSFATTTAAYRLKRLIPDELIPGTLNTGHSLPVILQAFIYIAIIEVQVTTLVAMIASAVLGAWLGAGVVAQWPRRQIQVGMGVALLLAATLMLLSQLNLAPGGGRRLA